MFEFYEFIRKQTRDAESKAGEGGLEFPAGYMFKDPVHIEADELGDPVEFLLHEMDRFNITKVITNYDDGGNGARADPRAPRPVRRRHRRRPQPGHGGGPADPAHLRGVRPQGGQRVPRRACTRRSR